MHSLSALVGLVVVLTLATSYASSEGVGGSSFPKNDITYGTEVVTPHIPWAKTLPGGPIKGFFIPSVQDGRDMVELMQRLELAPTTVSIDPEWDINCWGIGDYYSHEYRGDRDDFRIVYGYVEKDLTGPERFEVMVIPGLHGWSRLTRSTRDAILQRVSDGAGLVLIHPFVGDVKQRPFAGDEQQGDSRVWEVSPLVGCLDDLYDDGGYLTRNREAIAQGKWEVAQRHFITEGMPLELLPPGLVGGSFYKYRARGAVLVKSGEYPIIAVGTYGKGRVVALAYVNEGFVPQTVDPFGSRIYWDYWEYYYSLLARCVLWAAGRESDLSILSLSAGPGENAVQASLSVPTDRTVEIEVRGKSEFGPPLRTYRQIVRLVAGTNRHSVPASTLRAESGWPGGRRIFDVIIRDPASGATLNWGTASYAAPKQAFLTSIEPTADLYRDGEVLSASVRAAGDLKGLSVRFRVSDDLERLLTSQLAPAAERSEFSYRLANYIGSYAFVAAELVGPSGAVVDQLRLKPLLVVQSQRRQKEYRPLVSFGGGRHYFGAMRRQLVRAAGADIGFVWGMEVNNGLNIPGGTFGIYWYHRGPTNREALEAAIAEYERTGNFDALAYNTKVELFRRTGDKKFLTRTPCFDDPKEMQKLYDTVYETAKQKSRCNFDYYFVGDEGSLTSYGDAVGFCWSTHTLAAFREWLKQGYGSLEALNTQWGTSFRDWDSVVPYTTEEARQSGRFAPWADHRTYMETVFAHAYQTVREAVVAGDPDGHIAVSGTQATNAYNGCDWYRLDKVIDDFLSYGGGNQWDLHRSFAKPGAIIGFWTGYGSSGLGVQNAIWSAAISNVLHPSIFWMFSYLNPDFTYSKSARDMGTAFKALRFEGVGKLFMESERLGDGIALHFSMPSVHAATITGNHGGRRSAEAGARSFPGNRDGWAWLIRDLGMDFDFVAYEQVEQGRLRGGSYRAFVLPLSMAISPEEAKAIREFVQRGGVVIADAAAGVMDDHCSWAEQGMLADLFGISVGGPSERRFVGVQGEVTVTAEGRSWGLETDELAGLEAVEQVKAAQGTALLQVGGADAAIVRRVGEGWAIYLNLLLDGYSRERRRAFGGRQYRSVLGALLTHLGIRPTIQAWEACGIPLSQAMVVRYRLGDTQALAIVKENVGLEGRDGVTIYDDSQLGRVQRQQITIRLPRKYWVTDVRTGERLGYTDTVETSIVVGGALVLGLSEVENELELSGPASAALGDQPEFTIKLARPGKAIVRCHLFGPDGAFLPSYARNVLIDNGAGTVVLPSALNDAAGQYTLKVTDVMTGAGATATLLLR